MRKRWLLVPVVGLVLIFGAAFAVAPTNCNYPDSYDSFSSLVTLQNLTPDTYNKLQCVVDRLQHEVGTSGSGLSTFRTACTSASLAAAERKRVTITFSGSPFAGTEVVLSSVNEATSPTRLDVDGTEPPTGFTASVWVFNRDALNARSGTVCAAVSH